MSAGEAVCPVCGGGPFPASYNGFATHDSGPRHRLFLMGIMPDDAAGFRGGQTADDCLRNVWSFVARVQAKYVRPTRRERAG